MDLAQVARWASVLLMVFIGLAGVLGRSVEQGFPSLIPFIPIAGGIALLAGAFVIRRLAQSPLSGSTATPYPFLARKYEAAAAVALVVGAMVTCELLVQLPIERVHFFKYLVLGVLLYFSQRSASFSVRCLTAFASAALVGVIDENLQRFIPRRFYDLNDILLNVAAASWGVSFAPLLDRWAHGLFLAPEQSVDSAALD